MKKLLALFILTFSFLHAADTLTTVSDTLSGADGLTLSGSFTIDYPSMTLPGGTTVQKSTRTVQISNGVVNLPLYPNDTAYPTGTSYRVSYNLISNAGTLSYKEYWVIPTSATSVSVSSVRTTSIPVPNLLFSCNQLPAGCAVQPGSRTFPIATGATSLSVSAIQHGLGPNIIYQAFDSNGVGLELNATLDLSGNVSLTWDIPLTSPGSVVLYSGTTLSRNYSVSFTAQSALTLVGGSNAINNLGYTPQCWSTTFSPLEYTSYTIDSAFNVVVTFFASSSSGRCIFGRL